MPDLLHPGTDTVAVTVEVPGRSIPFAIAVESLRRQTRDGRPVWEQTYEWFGNDGSRTADTLWFDGQTLAPVENHRHNGAHDAVTRFEAGAVHTRLLPKSGAPVVLDTMIAGPLYASGELAALLRTAPLVQGYRATYSLYYGPPRIPVRLAPIEVTRTDTVTTRAGARVSCWVVEAALSEGRNTFFISKADRRVLRLENHEDPRATFLFRQ